MVIGVSWARGSGSTLAGKNKYPVLGKPLIYYPLHSLRLSGAVDHHYVFTEDDEIADTAFSLGWGVVPRAEKYVSYGNKDYDHQGAWKSIVTHICKDLSLPVPKALNSWLQGFYMLADTVFHMNCNNCMIRSRTYARMLEILDQKNANMVVPACRIDGPILLGQPDDSLYPLWHPAGVNRQFMPPVFGVLGNTFFRRPGQFRQGKPNMYYCEIDHVEAIDVHDKTDIDLVEFYLSRYPDYFG